MPKPSKSEPACSLPEPEAASMPEASMPEPEASPPEPEASMPEQSTSGNSSLVSAENSAEIAEANFVSVIVLYTLEYFQQMTSESLYKNDLSDGQSGSFEPANSDDDDDEPVIVYPVFASEL